MDVPPATPEPGPPLGPPPGPYGPARWDAWPPPPVAPYPVFAPAPRHRASGLRTAATTVALIAMGAVVGGALTGVFSGGRTAGTPGLGQPAGGSGGIIPGFGGLGGGSGTGSGAGSSGGALDASTVAAKVDPAIVDITTELSLQGGEAAGTGIVLTSNGEVVTNNHVIKGATSISVTDIGNGRTYSASVVGYDESADIAVIQLQNASGLTTAQPGDSSRLTVGDAVLALGNAGGQGGTPTPAGGTVTALSQSITASDASDGSSEQLSGLIQVNAAIQPGDSGGPLANSSAQVVGIDVAGSTGGGGRFRFGGGAGGEGYAIPINTALALASQIEQGNAGGSIHIGETAFLGIAIDPSAAQSQAGVPLAGVEPNTAAAAAGLAQGDVVTAFDGQTLSTPDDLTRLLVPHHPGDRVSVSWTDTTGASHTATVTLGSGPPA